MNNYKIYLTESNGNYAELDTEGIDITTVFSVAELADISLRKDTISKTITLKGTKENNKAFGYLFNLNRSTNIDFDEKLFFNYSSSVPVDCLVYEDSQLLYKGTLTVLEVSRDASGNISYECVITGYLIDFYSKLSDLELEDLDFNDFKHDYTLPNVSNSWDTSITKNNISTPFSYGKGFVYPFIDYGVNSSPYPPDVNKIHFSNLRPAIYVKEYINKIFQQPKLSGYTYEIKGTPDFIDDFNHLIIPYNEEKFTNDFIGGYAVTLTKSTGSGLANSIVIPANGELKKAIRFDTVSDSKGLITPNTTNVLNETNNVFQWDRDVSGDMEIKLNITVTNKNNPNPIFCFLRLVERDYLVSTNGSYSNLNNWQTVSEKLVSVVNPNTTFPATDIILKVPYTAYKAKKQFMLMFYCKGDSVGYTSGLFDFTVNTGYLNAPAATSNKLTYSVEFGDEVTPAAATGILQKDFIKSLMTLFNLYVYPSKDNPKHLIFEKYRDYYGLTTPTNLLGSALNWTDKIDYSANFRIKTYNELAKKYSFDYKPDSDYFNDTLYKQRYDSIYGNFTTSDSIGTGDEKKIELIFSPTPSVTYNDTNRSHPSIFKVENSNLRIPLKSNIRILYYNGIKDCNSYQVGTMELTTGNTYSFTGSTTYSKYPQAGHLRLNEGVSNLTYKSDLNFGTCKEYFFLADSTIQTIPNSFTSVYEQQLHELTNSDNVVIECNMYLNENDISNLDLKVPIYIDTPNGNAYFKLINVEYSNKNEAALVKLQKINL